MIGECGVDQDREKADPWADWPREGRGIRLAGIGKIQTPGPLRSAQLILLAQIGWLPNRVMRINSCYAGLHCSQPQPLAGSVASCLASLFQDWAIN